MVKARKVVILDIYSFFIFVEIAFKNSMELILLTRCLGKSPQDETLFHFKGVFLGNKIKYVKLRNSTRENIVVGEDYILHINAAIVKGFTLRGTVIRVKNLNKVSYKI